MSFAYFDPPTPRLFAHRGECGLCPENTMVSFQRAVDGGALYLESDAHLTADGKVVLCHDAELERTTNGTGLLKTHTWAELRALDAGFAFTLDGRETYPFRDKGVTIPLLSDVLDAFPDQRLNLEVKQADPPAFEAVIALIRDRGRTDDVLLACEGDVVRDHLDSVDHGMPRNHSGSEVLEFLQAVHGGGLADYRPPAQVFQIPETYEGMPILTPEFLDAAHSVGVEVHVWTVNTPDDMRRLLDMGVDGIMSDFPTTLRKVANG